MAWRKHPRHMTDEQFADGTTIDGNRLDDAMEDIKDRFNSVPLGDLKHRFVQTQYVAGWTPHKQAAKHHWPWLRSKNVADTANVVGTLPDSISNTYRTKGYSTIGAPGEEFTAGGDAIHYTWSTSCYFHKPGVLQDIFLRMQIDASEFRNTFKYGSTPPEGTVQSEGNRDFAFVIHVDSPFAPEDRTQNNPVVLRSAVNLAREWTNGILISSVAGDMAPSSPPWVDIQGVFMPIRNANIPIPRDSRVRIDCVIPDYSNANNGGWGDTNPWAQNGFEVVFTMLEEVEQ